MDLQKIRDIRWILKRRYLKSRNFKRIFKFWDMDNKGAVTAQNVYDMCKRLGINASPLECEVLLATVDRRGAGELSPDEFVDFIYNDVVVVDMDASKIKDGHIVDSRDVAELKQQLNENARKMRQTKRMNQVKFVLKNHMKTFLRDLKREDIDGSGQINHHTLEKVIKTMNIGEQVIDEEDMARLFRHYSHESNKMNYQAMCDDILQSKLDTENMYVDADRKPEPKPTFYDDALKNAFVKRLRELDAVQEDIAFVDNKSMPYNSLENASKKMMKMRRFLKNYFPEEAQFVDYLCSSINVPSDQLAKTNLHRLDMKKVMDKLLVEVGQKLDNRLMEGFYSTFSYNKHGQVNVKDLVDVLYKENEKDFYIRVMKRLNGPPLAYDDNHVETIKLSEEELNAQKMVRDVHYDLRAPTEEGVVRIMDDKMHTVARKFLDLYRQFDHDQDGFVSCNDLRNTIIKNNWMSHGETEAFVRYADPQQQGFVNFHDFNKRIRTNMSNWDEHWQTKERNIMQPSREHVQKRWQDFKNMSKTFTTLKKPFLDPAADPSSRPSPDSRYGFTPAHQNTFLHFQHMPQQSPMYLADRDRLQADNFSRTSYQLADREKKAQSSLARITAKRSNSQQTLKRVEAQDQLREARDKNKLTSKAVSNLLYAHKSNMSNRLEFY